MKKDFFSVESETYLKNFCAEMSQEAQPCLVYNIQDLFAHKNKLISIFLRGQWTLKTKWIHSKIVRFLNGKLISLIRIVLLK